MKRLVLMMIPAMICGMVFSGCNSEETGKNVSKLQYVKTELGGCNVEPASRSSETETEENQVIITVSDESVNVFVGLNYTCKELSFETKCETENNVLCMYLIDSGGEYYRCNCYYTFDFIFDCDNTKALNQKYKILLVDPRKEGQTVILEGKLVGSK